MQPSFSLLRLFRHPVLIISILILLVNDHVLKTSAPSALTGKISDFAGLFFFPFLVAVIIQQSGKTFRLKAVKNPQIALLAGFFITGGFFTAIKISPTVNTFTASCLSRLLNTPVQIALDPTDLMALVVFLPAWLFLQHRLRKSTSRPPGKLAYAMMSLGALASLATPPCQTLLSIQHLASKDGILYADANSYFYPDNTYQLEAGFSSSDLGKTWTTMDQKSPLVQALSSKPEAATKTICDPSNQEICYRIAGKPMVEISTDGGQTWQIAWQIPTGRESYMQRVASMPLALMSCGRKEPDIIPYDMTLVPAAGGSVLLVAMGNEGLLIHSPLEGWKRTGFYETYSGYTSLVFNTSPTPFKAVTFGDVISYVYEIPLALALGFILFLVFSVIAWVYASRHIFSPEKRPVKWIFRPVWILAIWIIVLALLWGLSGIRINLVQNIVLLILAALTLGFPLAIVVISLVVWHRAIAAASDGQKLIDLRTLILLASGVILVIACVYFPLWAFGIIAAYSTALVLAVITYLVFLAICAYGVRNTLLYPGKT